MPGDAQKGLGAASQARSARLNQASGAVAWRREESQITLVPRSWGPLTTHESRDGGCMARLLRRARYIKVRWKRMGLASFSPEGFGVLGWADRTSPMRREETNVHESTVVGYRGYLTGMSRYCQGSARSAGRYGAWSLPSSSFFDGPSRTHNICRSERIGVPTIMPRLCGVVTYQRPGSPGATTRSMLHYSLPESWEMWTR